MSDLHISRFRTASTRTFERFVGETVPTVDPAFVVVTGDMTDGAAILVCASVLVRGDADA